MIVRALILGALWLVSQIALASPHCADFLQALARKPPNLEFIECKAGHEQQLRALVASYRVDGRHAAAIERYLVRHTGMSRLRFACCGWEPNTRKIQRTGHVPSSPAYEITMASEETVVARRSDWSQIPWFYVTVTLPLEAP